MDRGGKTPENRQRRTPGASASLQSASSSAPAAGVSGAPQLDELLSAANPMGFTRPPAQPQQSPAPPISRGLPNTTLQEGGAGSVRANPLSQPSAVNPSGQRTQRRSFLPAPTQSQQGTNPGVSIARPIAVRPQAAGASAAERNIAGGNTAGASDRDAKLKQMTQRLAQRRQALGNLAEDIDGERFFAVMLGIQKGVSTREIEEITDVSEIIILRWKEKLHHEGFEVPTKYTMCEADIPWAKDMMRRGLASHPRSC